jgi:ubiquinone/menaquinone biosynthesis C-methylase UbiE
MGQWRSWGRSALPHLRGQRILEIAHGTGNLLLDLTALGFAPVGIDLSAAMGAITKRKLRARGLFGRIPLARGRVQALPFANATFDSVLATFPTEFIIDPSAIAEFHRALKPGGVLVCVPSARIIGPGLPDRFAAWLFRVTGQAAGDWYAPILQRYHAHGFTAHTESVTLPRSIVTLLIAQKSL